MTISTTGTTCMKYSEEERRRRRRNSSSIRSNRDTTYDNTDCVAKIRSATTSSVIFWLWLVLILAQLRSLSAIRRNDMVINTHEEHFARGVHQFRELASVHNSKRHKSERVVVVSGPSRLGSNKEKKDAKLFEDDKRRVHTGPNPLHN